MQALETPGDDEAPDWGSIYLYRGEEVSKFRPVFTGDVFLLPENAGMVQIIQHPCAIRLDGVHLVPQLLVSTVDSSKALKPSAWKGNFKQFPLPDLEGDGTEHRSAFFHKPSLVSPDVIGLGKRVACLSQFGVNLLLQRWVHHNSRVVVPTWSVDEATAEQYEEADLVEEWGESWDLAGLDPAESESSVHDWLRSDAGNGSNWQSMLSAPQTRSKVRSAMRGELRRITTEAKTS
ncbi:Uncharacterised protein [Mycobacteroides abscessus subsp. abscessus]|nr:Uncharacterised protein [Mycobacteroides abscessus subsp. abscessus]